MNRAVIYARYSSNRQNEASIEQQIKDCEELAKREGFTIVGTYVDRAKSGTDEEHRENYKRMLKDIERGTFDIILVWHSNRIARDSYIAQKFYHTIEAYRIKCFSFQEPMLNQENSQLFRDISAAFNSNYSRELSERMTAHMKSNAEKGKFNGGYRNYGYDTDENGRYIINKEEEPIVQEIFDSYLKGKSSGTIAKELNKNGYKNAQNKPFDVNYITRLLKNPMYKGTKKWRDIDIDVPPIVDEETFKRAQAKLKANSHIGNRINARHQYALAGKLFCGECGSSFTGESPSKKIKKKEELPEVAFATSSAIAIMEAVKNPEYEKAHEDKVYIHYYACKSKGDCHRKRYLRDDIEKTVVNYTAFQYLTDTNIKKIANALFKLQDTNPNAQEIKEQDKIIEAETQKVKKLLDLMMMLELTGEEEISDRLKQASHKKQQAIEEKERLENSSMPEKTKEEFVKDLKGIKKEILKFVDDDVIPQNVVKEFCDIFVNKVYIYESKDGGKPYLKIVYDTEETSGLVNFDNNDVEISSTIDPLGSPKKEISPRLISFFMFLIDCYHNGDFN